jgi:secreted PhoX family phosphatase
MRGTGKRTVIIATEDGPRTPDSQLYLYVGRKDRSSRDPLRRNGLDNGKLYAFASDDSRDDENQLLQGDDVAGHWVEIPGADALTDVQTEAAADAAGAFGFVRVEDGEFRPNAKRELWFNTTGDQTGRSEADPHTNELGRLYRLRFHGADPLDGATLTQAYNADQLTPAQDGPMSPDNLTVTRRTVVINEDGTAGSASDGTTGSRDDMDRRNRDGSIWVLPLATPGDPSTFQRVAQLVGRDEGGRDGVRTVDERANRAGVWETSGVVDARRAFGRDTFLFDVQAHAPTMPPGGRPITVEDGQLLILRRTG